jgi:hypothetical protein
VSAGTPCGFVARNRGNFASSVAARIATSVAHADANQVVKTIPAGSFEPAAARSARTPVGMIASPAVLIARKSTMAFVAVPFTGFSRSSSCMARIPNGVAAFPNPRIFEPMLRIIALIAGWSSGTSGKRRRMTGAAADAIRRSRPPSDATFMRPMNKDITPTRPKASSTDVFAASRAEDETASM